MSKSIGLLDVKQALRDQRFRDSLPPKFAADIQQFLQNPGCACNVPIYKKIMTEATAQLQQYFPNRIVSNLEEEANKLAQNHFSVINCHVNELEEKMRKLPSGRKQIAVARFEDQVTVVVNELDILF